MDESEKLVYDYLVGQGIGSVEYEPNGNVPPDFLVDGRIAVEVRRLNQNWKTPNEHRGLEEVEIPLYRLVEQTLAAIGSPMDGKSWFVSYNFRRPLPRWEIIRARLGEALSKLKYQQDLENKEIEVTENFHLRFYPADTGSHQLFVPGGWIDRDSGGFIVAEMARNLQICFDEKSKKVANVWRRYPEWWLIFDDHISYGALNERDRGQLRNLVQVDGVWSKITLLNRENPSLVFDL